jgi:hypothetical protein
MIGRALTVQLPRTLGVAIACALALICFGAVAASAGSPTAAAAATACPNHYSGKFGNVKVNGGFSIVPAGAIPCKTARHVTVVEAKRIVVGYKLGSIVISGLTCTATKEDPRDFGAKFRKKPQTFLDMSFHLTG